MLRGSIADKSCVVYLDLPVEEDTSTKQVAGTAKAFYFSQTFLL